MMRGARLLPITAIIILAGCDGSSTASTRDLADVADTNSRNALYQIDRLEARID